MTILLPENVPLRTQQVVIGETLSVTLRSEEPTSVCPSCGQAGQRVHSRDLRRTSDLPVSGRPVRLTIEVRRFFCDQEGCPRITFAEHMPALVRPHAQRTQRLQLALQELGLASGGEAGARLGREWGLLTSPDRRLAPRSAGQALRQASGQDH
jgi:zinc-finger of transposase IS204/IS1001/IS1096/IS1165